MSLERKQVKGPGSGAERGRWGENLQRWHEQRVGEESGRVWSSWKRSQVSVSSTRSLPPVSEATEVQGQMWLWHRGRLQRLSRQRFLSFRGLVGRREIRTESREVCWGNFAPTLERNGVVAGDGGGIALGNYYNVFFANEGDRGEGSPRRKQTVTLDRGEGSPRKQP